MRPSKTTPAEELWILSGISESDKGTDKGVGSGTCFWGRVLGTCTCFGDLYLVRIPLHHTALTYHTHMPHTVPWTVYPCCLPMYPIHTYVGTRTEHTYPPVPRAHIPTYRTPYQSMYPHTVPRYPRYSPNPKEYHSNVSTYRTCTSA